MSRYEPVTSRHESDRSRSRVHRRRRVFSAVLESPAPYRAALEAQRRAARARIDGEWEDDLLLLVEHEPVVTLGRGARAENVRATPEVLAARGVDRVEIERGGDVTYHGPGQLVGYPILDLRDHRTDLHWYMRALEEALIRAAAELGVTAVRAEGHTGVWAGERAGDPLERDLEADAAAALVASGSARKIASIGVHVSRWVTWHGFALNVTDEPLEAFDLIVPCGISGARMTSLEAEGRRPEGGPLGEELRAAVERGFAAAFDVPVERARSSVLERLRRLVPEARFETPRADRTIEEAVEPAGPGLVGTR